MMRHFLRLTACFVLVGCTLPYSREKRFTLLKPQQTGIDFVNRIADTDTLNIIKYLYYYNGGGVAIGDVNNDGLSDIYFTSNLGDNKLYLNQGNFRFMDITYKAGVAGTSNWTTGVTMADVNADGWLDIYVCEVGGYRNFKGRNRLYINNGDLSFNEQAEQFNLDFAGFATHATFFDYDRDGDLDVYLLNHSVHANYSLADLPLRYTSDPLSGDRLMRNDNGSFTDVSSQAGILTGSLGYGLSVTVSDFNNDGWPDVYVCNDFRENDYLYINNGNGTFRQVIEQAMPHTSRFSMGSDAADVNNDLKTDLITLDMLPDDEGIRKRSAGEDSYEIFQHKLSYGFHYQFSRNALQLNQGVLNSTPVFSDIAAYAGVEATDWSWSALFADLDNDGRKDLFITNGILRRPNDLDYISYIASTPSSHLADLELVNKMPRGEAVNRIYQNLNGLKFRQVQWMEAVPDCSQGAAFADLDLDGDLDLVVNVQNRPALIYRNNTATDSAKYLRIKLTGSGKNTFAVGARVMVFSPRGQSLHELYQSRGWQSAVEPVIHAGLGTDLQADSVIIIWPDGPVTKLFNVHSNQQLLVRQNEYAVTAAPKVSEVPPVFAPVNIPGLSFVHRENDFSAISTEPLLPFSLTATGPPMAVADVNDDGMDDVFVGGASGQSGMLYLQQADGTFRAATQPDIALHAEAEDTSCAFVDVNQDDKPDLIIVGGGHQFAAGHAMLKPRLYLNQGKGNFKYVPEVFAGIFTDAGVISVTDFDNDNLPDVFIGGRVISGAYGKTPDSFLLRNNGNGTFTDMTVQLLGTTQLGRISDACWTDINKDNRPDLLLAGHWMPLSLWLQQADGRFVNQTEQWGLKLTHGLWNCVAAADFNHDELPDFIAGNWGLNSRFRAGAAHPVRMYIHDFDANGTDEQVLVYPASNRPALFHSRDQLVKQIPSLKKKFLLYANYSTALPEEVFPDEKLQRAAQLQVVELASVLLKNNGNGFEIIRLPDATQFSPLWVCTSFEWPEKGTGILAAGNLLATQPDVGFLDAGWGTVLQVTPDFTIFALPPGTSGLYAPGETRNIAKLHLKKLQKTVFIISRNNRSLLAYTKNENGD